MDVAFFIIYRLKNREIIIYRFKNGEEITAYCWCDGYSISISVCGVWGVKTSVQVSKRELYTYI